MSAAVAVIVGEGIPDCPMFKVLVEALLTTVPAPVKEVATVKIPLFVNVPSTTVVGAVRVNPAALVKDVPDPTDEAPVTVRLAPVVIAAVPEISKAPPIVVITGEAVAEPLIEKLFETVVIPVITFAPLPLNPRL